MTTPIYLDYAAATPIDDTALRVAQPYFQAQFYNPSALYEPAREVRRAIEGARGSVADVLGARDQEIVFTAGGTEANNLAIHGVMQAKSGSHMIVSAIEHESVLQPTMQYDYSLAPVNEKGIVDIDAIEALIKPSTALISVMYANNEIGTVQPIKRLTELVNSVRTQRLKSGNKMPLYIHTDACQAANYLDLQVTRLGVDMMTLNGGKIYGFKQSGCLYIRKNVKIDPFITGGGQESGIRSGTENVAGLISFATMLQKVQKTKNAEVKRLSELSKSLYATLSQKVVGISLNGDAKKRLPNNVNILIVGVDGERLVLELDERGIMLATGSACTASNDEPSHVLRAIGLSDEQASGSLRITLGRHTTPEQIAQATDQIASAIQNVRLLVQ